MQEGWICPICKIGVSPYENACPKCYKERKLSSASIPASSTTSFIYVQDIESYQPPMYLNPNIKKVIINE